MRNNFNKLGLFVKITDTSKYIKDMCQDESTNLFWPNQQIRNLANETEWNKYKYIPRYGDIGEVVAKMEITEYKEAVYIIRTFGMFYIPIFESGFEEIGVKQSINI